MLNFLKDFFGLYVLVPVVLMLGIYLSVKLNWLQVRLLIPAFKSVLKKQKGKPNFSSFNALGAVLGGNLGTGNVAGIAVALSTGGPGALFWMWVMALFASIIKFTGVYLAVKYRISKNNKIFAGGPMFYILKGLNKPLIAKIFCVFTMLSACTVGNLVQVNSFSLPLVKLGVPAFNIGVGMAILCAIVLYGGDKYFKLVSSKIVPFMAVLYLSCSFVILFTNSHAIIPAINLIFKSAFSFESVAGGILGKVMFEAIRVGFDRGLFATDAGVGLAPILHAKVNSDDTIEKTAFTQGLISIIAPFIVMCICTVTGLVIMVTNACQEVMLESTNICVNAFRLGLGGKTTLSHVVTLTLGLFAFTSMITWAHCAEEAVEFIKKSYVKFFRIIFICIIPIGGFCKVGLVWTLADLMLNGMLLINVTAIIFLSKEVIASVKENKVIYKNNSSIVNS